MDFLIVVGVILYVLYRFRDWHRHSWSAWTRPVEVHTPNKAVWLLKRRCKKCGKEDENYVGWHPCSQRPCPHREQLDVLFHGMPGHVDFLEEELGLKGD